MTKNLLLPLLVLALTAIAGCGGDSTPADGGPTGGSDSGPPTGSDSGPRPDSGPGTDSGPATGDDGGPVADGGPTTGDDAGPATDGGPAGTDCAAYCTLMEANCDDEYASLAMCMTACAAFAEGTPGDMTGDTRACRIYHATAAGTAPDPHCGHAGEDPTGFCE